MNDVSVCSIDGSSHFPKEHLASSLLKRRENKRTPNMLIAGGEEHPLSSAGPNEDHFLGVKEEPFMPKLPKSHILENGIINSNSHQLKFEGGDGSNNSNEQHLYIGGGHDGGDSGDSDSKIRESGGPMPLSVNVSALPAIIPFDFSGHILESLKETAFRGDIPTAVTAIILLGDKIKGLVPDDLAEHWFLAYIDQLRRMQMFNKATVIIKKGSKYPLVQELQQPVAKFQILCPVCESKTKVLPKSFACRECNSVIGKCSWCQEVVSGLYTFCQGCGHGGHLYHIADWFLKHPTNEASSSIINDTVEKMSVMSTYNGHMVKTHTPPISQNTSSTPLMGNLVCPAGCGHLCQYM